MATYLFAQGLDPIELAEGETFNKARHRGNKAIKLVEDYKNGASDGEKFEPLHLLSFKTATDGGGVGRIAINVEKFIGIGSDEEKDGGDDDE